MLTQLLTETLLGALTGYVTNDTAIRSLFKPNGIIEQTRDEFAREAGKLLESQVLTPSVLARQMMLPEVQHELARALETFLHKELPEAFGDNTLADLPAHEIILDRIQQILLQFARQEREVLLYQLKKHFPIAELFTQEQCQKLADTLEQLVLEVLQEQQLAETIWQCWYREKGASTPETLGLTALCRTVAANLGQCSAQWQEELQSQYGEQLKTAAMESVQKLHLEELLPELDAQMEGYALRQYLDGSVDELADGLYRLLHAKEGAQLLDHVVEEVLGALATVDLPLAQLIPASVLDEVLQPLQQQMPQILQEVLEWAWRNKQALQHMLEEAVDEVAKQAGGMKGMLIEQLKETLLDELMQSSDTYEILLEVISDAGGKEQSVDWLMSRMRTLLTDNTVGQLVIRLNKNGKLQIMARQFLYENMERSLTAGDTQWLERILDMRPGALHLAQHKDRIEALLVQVLLGAIDRMDVSQMIATGCETFIATPLAQLLPGEPDGFVQYLQNAVHSACAYGADTLPQIKADTIYGAIYDAALGWLSQQNTDTMTAMANRCHLADGVQYAANALGHHTAVLTDGIAQAGLKMMQGRLSVLAQQQIQSLSNEEMLELVEDFMGRELQPLNYLGAGMGAVAGATVGTALAAAIPAVSMTSPALAAGVLAGKAAVFGAVGYTTNCAAVKGLFWPYEPVAGIHTIQGVIPKQKDRFAGSMGRLVDRYVINDNILKEQIALLKDTMEAKAVPAALADNEELFARLFAELAIHRRRAAEPVCRHMLQYGQSGSADMWASIGAYPLSAIGTILPATHEELQEVYQMLSVRLTAAMHKALPLDTIVDADTLWQWMETAVSGIMLPDLTGIARDALHSEKTPKQIAEAYGGATEQIDAIAALETTVLDRAAAYMTAPEGRERLAAGLTAIANGDKLYQWMANNSTPWVKDNLTMLFHWIESLLLELLRSRQNKLTAAVEQALLNRMGLMKQMGYAMINGGAIVAAIVDRLIHQKIPIFLSIKRKELETLLGTVWEQELAPIVLQAADTCLKTDTEVIARQTVQTLLAQPALQRCILHSGAYAIQLAADVPVERWGKYINVSAILARPQLQLGFRWQTHSRDIVACWKTPIQAFCADKLHTMTLAQLSHGYTEQIPVHTILAAEDTERAILQLSAGISAKLTKTTLQDWLYWEQISHTLSKDMAALCTDTAFQAWLGYEIELAILTLAQEPDAILPRECRRVLIDHAVQAVFATAESHGTTLLANMQLSGLAETQLKQMDSAHLEQVVRGFAEHYLDHIQNRGWLGAIFALPGMLVYLI